MCATAILPETMCTTDILHALEYKRITVILPEYECVCGCDQCVQLKGTSHDSCHITLGLWVLK